MNKCIDMSFPTSDSTMFPVHSSSEKVSDKKTLALPCSLQPAWKGSPAHSTGMKKEWILTANTIAISNLLMIVIFMNPIELQRILNEARQNVGLIIKFSKTKIMKNEYVDEEIPK